VVAAAVRRDRVLAVSATRAAPGFDTAAMVYVQQAHVLDRYATHRWADTPARLLSQLLTRTLDDSGGFRAVLQAPTMLPADLRLDSEIVQLRQSFLARPSRVELTLRVQLVELAGRRVLATRYIEVVQDAPSEDAAGGVAAANDAVARALTQVAAFCVEAAGDSRP
jgi:cholesterol transport system auxiliary component